MKKVILLLLIILSSHVHAFELCKEPELNKNSQLILESLNTVSSEKSGILTSVVIKNMTTDEADILFSKLSNQHKYEFWKFKLSDRLTDQKLSEPQKLFIEQSINLYKDFINEKIGEPEIVDKLQEFELSAIDLFGKEEAYSLFFTLTESVNSVKAESSDYAILEIGRPACDCDISSYFRCQGCTYKGQNCYWVSRGCGFLRAGPCNGKCPFL